MNHEALKQWLVDPDNEENCEECPYNDGYDSFQHRKPCGQWNCWVTILYKEEERE